jgi:acyl-CoA reductase-like NAD-dependent aldehyde dehydrogenase
VLPVLAYDAPDDAAPAAAIAYVNARPRPLALYVFDADARRADAVLARTTSGGAMINDVVYHVGARRAAVRRRGAERDGALSRLRRLRDLLQPQGDPRRGPFSGLELLRPPYGGRSGALIRWLTGRA